MWSYLNNHFDCPLQGWFSMNQMSPFRLQYSHAKVSECPKRQIGRVEEVCKISPVSPEDPNQAQLQLENSGDITRDIDSISPDISPAANSKNYAQNHSSGDSGYTGDIIHTSSSLPIHRLGRSDTFVCKDCNLKGDIWFMRQHICRGQSK